MLAEIRRCFGYPDRMAYQFIHLDSYARTGSEQTRTNAATGRKSTTRKWSASDIAAEAERRPGACPHVENPQKPTVLYGVSVSDAVAAAHEWAETATDAKGRKLRKDGHVLLAGVVSLPAERAADWPQFRADTLDWLREKYGDRLRSVIEHTDEAHPHLHFYAVPRPGERFETLHDGHKAAAEAKAAGKLKGGQNAAYNAAMRALQDDFGAQVGQPHGLTRLGPARRRLTRAEWRAEQAAAEALAFALPDKLPQASIASYRMPAGRKLPLVGEVYDAAAVKAAYNAGVGAGWGACKGVYEPIRRAITAKEAVTAEREQRAAAPAPEPEAAPAPVLDASTAASAAAAFVGKITPASQPKPEAQPDKPKPAPIPQRRGPGM